MTSSPIALLAVIFGAFSAVIALTTTLMVLWQGARRLMNQLVAFYSVSVFTWASSTFISYLEILHGEMVLPAFLTAGLFVAVTGFALLALAICVAEAWDRRWARGLLLAGSLIEIALGIQMYRGQVLRDIRFVDQRLIYAVDPRGIALLALAIALSPIALVILYRARHRAPKGILVGSALTVAAILSRLIPVAAGYPLGIPLVAVASLLFARTVLRAQLFDPAAEANRRLARLAHDLKTSEMRLSAVLSNTRDAIWSIDPDYQVESINPAARRLFHDTYGASIKVGSSLLDIAPEDLRSTWRSIYDKALRGERITFEQHFQIGSRTVESEVALSPIIDGEGVVKGVAAFARDITERNRSEVALRRAKKAAEDANRAKSSFLATMSHELRTPLNAIIGYAELIEESAQDGLEHINMNDLARIKESGSHLLTLIRDILDLSKIEADKMDLHVQEIDVRSLLAEVATIARPLIEKNGNTLRVEAEGDLGVIHADATRVRQVLLNLLSNAAKFTEKGVITLKAVRVERREDAPGELPEGAPPAGPEIQFLIDDTGIGIAEDQLGLLFQPFRQIDASMTRTRGGTGLGLALSRRFCQLMRGDITVESKPGKGSRFVVHLPVNAPLSHSESLPPTESMNPPEPAPPSNRASLA